MGDEFAECQKLHSHFGGKADGCQAFTADYSSKFTSSLLCKVCGCHQNYHRKLVYSKCNKIHDLKIPNSVDGCQRFVTILNGYHEPQPQCGACGCHQGFHQIEVTKEVISTSCGDDDVPFGLKEERF